MISECVLSIDDLFTNSKGEYISFAFTVSLNDNAISFTLDDDETIETLRTCVNNAKKLLRDYE